ncbi:MAG: phage integrase N-terminal SAM-like domain-containing protein [Deltaproteobacteria bacterium]|nr:phage integrase N-terminal SAM-like domain-containing protein [Deltaproteobacteria bacterium]
MTKYFNRSPAELGEAELKKYMLYMINERHLSEGTFRFYVAGLKFFYRTTLKREWPVEKIRHPRSKRNLPVVLRNGPPEVDRYRQQADDGQGE